MKIGIQARFLIQPYTGIGQVTWNLLAALAEMDRENEYFLAVPEEVDAQEGFKGKYFKWPVNFKVEVIPEVGAGPAGIRKYRWEQSQVPEFFREKQVDLAHYLYPANPQRGLESQSGEKIPTLVTVHDLIPFKLKAYRRKLKTRWYLNQVKKGIKKADYLVTVSEATKKDLAEYWAIEPERVQVIYNAASPVFRQPVAENETMKVLKKYNLGKPFLLYVGGYDERKNVAKLLDVFVREIAPNEAVDLVMVGEKLHASRLYQSFEKLTAYAQESSIKGPQGKWKGGVEKLGMLEENELNALYQKCLALVNLSREEGFNIPLVEAAAAGAPVIASDIPVHREILGGGAGFCDSEDEEKIAQTFRKVIQDQTWREQLKQVSERISQKYSWKKAAQAYLKLYQKLTAVKK